MIGPCDCETSKGKRHLLSRTLYFVQINDRTRAKDFVKMLAETSTKYMHNKIEPFMDFTLMATLIWRTKTGKIKDK